MIQVKTLSKGFALIPALFVIILLNTTIFILCDYTINVLGITYSIKKGHQDYIESYAKHLISFEGLTPINITLPDKWIVSNSKFLNVPDWNYLLNSAYKCTENILPGVDSNLITTNSTKTCTSLNFNDHFVARVIGNISIANLTLQTDELINGYAQIISSGTIKFSELQVSVPTLIISGSGIQIDRLSGNSKVYILAGQDITIKQNLIPHLSKNYKNFHLSIDKIQSEPIGNLVKIINPPIYGFWFDRYS
jgi:hypothetical protein